MYYVTLSSIPPRFPLLGPTLETLLAQTQKPSSILLYIPENYARFPDWDGRLPDVPTGVEIRRTPKDIGPATKILPAAREFAGQPVDLLFCDDDRIFAPEWSGVFLKARASHPNAAIALRGLGAPGMVGTTEARSLQPRAEIRRNLIDLEFQFRRLQRLMSRGPYAEPERRRFRTSGYTDMFEGAGGVLVRPDMFGDEAWDIPEIAWGVDDIWLSGMLAKNNIPIWLEGNVIVPENAPANHADPLARADINGMDRRSANQAVVRLLQKQYGVWLG